MQIPYKDRFKSSVFKKGTQTSGRILLHRKKTVKKKELGSSSCVFVSVRIECISFFSPSARGPLYGGTFAWGASIILPALASCLSMGYICWSHWENGLTVSTAISLQHWGWSLFVISYSILLHPADCSLWDGFFLHMYVVLLLKNAKLSWEIVWLKGYKCGASLCLIPFS